MIRKNLLEKIQGKKYKKLDIFPKLWSRKWRFGQGKGI
jgi:hypothetical protein